jgi:hypothetical protein
MGADTSILVPGPYSYSLYLFYLYHYIIIYVYLFRKIQNYYTFLVKMFIYNIMQTQCIYVIRNVNFIMRLVIILFIIFMSNIKIFECYFIKMIRYFIINRFIFSKTADNGYKLVC